MSKVTNKWVVGEYRTTKANGEDVQGVKFLPKTPVSVSPLDAERWEGEIQRYINDFIKAFIPSLDAPTIAVSVNNRLRSSIGRFARNYNNDGSIEPKIEISGKWIQPIILLDYQRNHLSFLEGVLRHEALHYALYLLEVPHSDGTDSFERALYLSKTPASFSTNQRLVYENTVSSGMLWRYYTKECNACGHSMIKTSTKKPRVDPCSKCGSIDVSHPNEIVYVENPSLREGSKVFDGVIPEYVNQSYVPPRGLFSSENL